MNIATAEMRVLEERFPEVDWGKVSDYRGERSFLLTLEVYRFLFEVASKCDLEHRTWEDFVSPFSSQFRSTSVMPPNHERLNHDAKKNSLNKRTTGNTNRSTSYFPDEMALLYLLSVFPIGANASEALEGAPDEHLTRILTSDWKDHSKLYGFIALQDAKNNTGCAATVEKFAEAIVNTWDDSDARNGLLSRAYDGDAETHVIPQYIDIEPDLAPLYVFKKCSDLLCSNESLSRNERVWGLCDAIEHLFYELCCKGLQVNRASLIRDPTGDYASPYRDARERLATGTEFANGSTLAYSCSYKNRLFKGRPSKAAPDNGFFKQFLKVDESQRSTPMSQTGLEVETVPQPTNHTTLDVAKYLLGLSECPYYSQLPYRGGDVERAAGGFSTLEYVSRSLRSHGDTKGSGPMAEAGILSFGEGIQLHLLCAGAGGGKTSLARSIVMALATKDVSLCQRMGFKQQDERLGFVPFSMSFNPYPYEYEKPAFENGSYLEVVDSLIVGDGVEAFNVTEAQEKANVLSDLCERVLFIIDAFDEADDWATASKAISSLKNQYPKAKIIVTSRCLSEMPSFMRGRSCMWSLEPMNGEQKLELVSSYLDEYHGDTEKRRRDSFAASLVGSRFCSDLIGNPLFASTAVIGWDDTKDGTTALAPSSVYRRVIDRLTEKASDVVSRQYDGSDYSLTNVDSERLISRLALVTFLSQKHLLEDLDKVEAFRGCSRFIGDVPVRRLCFSNLMSSLCASLGLSSAVPSSKDFWRRYAIAAGIVAFVPDSQGGAFEFESADYQTYLAAVGFAEMLAFARGDMLRLFDGLVNKCLRADPSVTKFITMCFTTVTEQFQGAGLRALDSSMALLNVIVSRIRETEPGEPGTPDEYDPVVCNDIAEILDGIASQDFGPTSVARYDLLLDGSHPYAAFVGFILASLRTWLAENSV